VGGGKTGGVLLISGVSLILGFTNVIRLPKLSVDCSYGIYIYSFPIQQFLFAQFGIRSALHMFAYAVPSVLLFAYFSWHVIEAPCIRYAKSKHRKLAESTLDVGSARVDG
jgi:peptidoglycan/LPS O-acetylase OafA/YrhL